MLNVPRRLLALLPLVVTACSLYYDAPSDSTSPWQDWPLPDPDDPGQTAHRSRVLEVGDDGSVTLTVRELLVGQSTETTLDIVGGDLVLSERADHTLLLESLEVRLADAVVPTQGQTELRITGIRLSLAEPVAIDATWPAAGEHAFARVPVVLTLDWKLEGASGRAWPLATQQLEGMTLYVHVDGDRPQWVTEVLGYHGGTFWEWSGIYAMSDAIVKLKATEVGPD